MIRLAILVAVLALAGCGSHHHASPQPTSPPSTPFADIAGSYTATRTFGTGLPYDGIANGTAYAVSIAADGTATVGAAVYHLTRLADGSFKTLGRPIVGGLTEFGTLPADLSTVHLESLRLWAGSTDQGALQGQEDLGLVAVAPVGAG